MSKVLNALFTSLTISVLIALLSVAYFYVGPKPTGVDEISFLKRETKVSEFVFLRMLGNVLFQSYFNPVANLEQNSLKGQLILVTGGNKGIGYETAKGLVLRGADVIIASRDEVRSKNVTETIKMLIESNDAGSISYVRLDLSDLEDVSRCVNEIILQYPDRKFDQIVENSGLWPSDYTVSKQGYEIAFATNVAGHHLLLRKLMRKDKLADDARIIILTGDIYITADDCTPDYEYKPNSQGFQQAYSRSKICVNWLFYELHERYPKYKAYLVHPGVIATELTGPIDTFKKLAFIDQVQGAQTTLITASHKSPLLINGAYYHNTYGRVILPTSDVNNNRTRSRKAWDLLENIVLPYL
jgi:NAD(P)-dependent dehydrogenase (short-subunit alcohol dehydrogenase family)